MWEGWKAGFLALHAFHTLSFPWPAWKRVPQNHNHRQGPFWEQEPLVRDGDYSATSEKHVVHLPETDFNRARLAGCFRRCTYQSRIGNEKSLIEQLSGLGHFPGRELYKMPVIRTSGSKCRIVFCLTIPSSENRLRSESLILSGSGGVEARTHSGQRRAALCRTNVTALQEMV